MRRKDREITDVHKIIEILKQCDVCRIGMIDNDRVYVVPMSFGFEFNDPELAFYFHGAREGKKIDLLKINQTVCLEFDTNCELVEGKTGCSYSAHYQSVIAQGRPEFLDGDDKRKGLDLLMAQYTGRSDFTYPQKMLDGMAVYKVTITEITAKEHM